MMHCRPMTLDPVVKDGLQYDRVKVIAREVVLQPLAMVIGCSIAVTNVELLPVHAMCCRAWPVSYNRSMHVDVIPNIPGKTYAAGTLLMRQVTLSHVACSC